MSDTFVIEKSGKPYRHSGSLFLFCSLGDCKSFIRQQDSTYGYKPRPATPEELREGKVRMMVLKRSDGTSVSPSVSSGNRVGLVSIHEDLGGRRFAISSRASNEAEFVFEVASALASLPDVEQSLLDVRYREFIPLVVDMCCKYRGYKAESVQESVLLVAGDLDMPGALNNNIHDGEKE